MSSESPPDIDPAVRQMAERFLREGTSKRALLVVRLLLERGTVTTSEIQAEGYDHPPRAIGDVRDAGFPLIMEWFRDEKKRRMGRFRFGRAEDIREGRFAGRTAIPKAFRTKLIEHYGAVDYITGVAMPATMLQVDHRVPYRVSGDEGLAAQRVEDFMLLDASSQRSKSWSCESCENWLHLHDPAVCHACFWASPRDYKHVAMQELRRTDVIWKGKDIFLHDRMKEFADAKGMTMAEALIELVQEGIL